MTGIDIAILRLRSGLRQWEVAADLGYSSAWLSKLERGKNPLGPEVAKRLAETIEKLAGIPA